MRLSFQNYLFAVLWKFKTREKSWLAILFLIRVFGLLLMLFCVSQWCWKMSKNIQSHLHDARFTSLMTQLYVCNWWYLLPIWRCEATNSKRRCWIKVFLRNLNVNRSREKNLPKFIFSCHQFHSNEAKINHNVTSLLRWTDKIKNVKMEFRQRKYRKRLWKTSVMNQFSHFDCDFSFYFSPKSNFLNFKILKTKITHVLHSNPTYNFSPMKSKLSCDLKFHQNYIICSQKIVSRILLVHQIVIYFKFLHKK